VSKVVLNSALVALNVVPGSQIPAHYDSLDVSNPKKDENKDTYDVIILGTGIK
jgi:hypothetical protein